MIGFAFYGDGARAALWVSRALSSGSQAPLLQTWSKAQSPTPAQLVLQEVVPWQAYGVQSATDAAQMPLTLHVKLVSRDARQVVNPHTVPTGWLAHWPLPLHRPFVPQVVADMATHTPTGSSPSMGTGWQVPALPATAHEKQLGQLADPQQTPSTQLPLVHSAPATHASPLGLDVQEPDRQNNPGVQSPSAAHTVRQAAGPHL